PRGEASKDVTDAVPFRVDHSPADPSLKNWPAERFEITGQVCWLAAGRGFAIHAILRSLVLAALEEGCERARVEDHRDGGDLAIADLVPLAGSRAGDRRGLEVVDHADVIAVHEHLPLVHAGDDPAQLPQRSDVAVGVAEGIDRPRERDVVMEQLTRTREILGRPGAEEILSHLS